MANEKFFNALSTPLHPCKLRAPFGKYPIPLVNLISPCNLNCREDFFFLFWYEILFGRLWCELESFCLSIAGQPLPTQQFFQCQLRPLCPWWSKWRPCKVRWCCEYWQQALWACLPLEYKKSKHPDSLAFLLKVHQLLLRQNLPGTAEEEGTPCEEESRVGGRVSERLALILTGRRYVFPLLNNFLRLGIFYDNHMLMLWKKSVKL